MSGTAYVNGKIVSEASMLAQIIKDKTEWFLTSLLFHSMRK
jgi:hypothetical protein